MNHATYDHSQSVRAASATALRSISSDAAVQNRLVQLLETDTPLVRIAASAGIENVSTFLTPHLIRKISRALDDRLRLARIIHETAPDRACRTAAGAVGRELAESSEGTRAYLS